MESLIKDKVVSNFSRYWKHYDDHAFIQRRGAAYLSKGIEGIIPDLLDGPVLEFGCGTGLVTKLVLKSISNSHEMILTDISENMIKRCKCELELINLYNSNISFEVLDAETIDVEEKYALILSGFTVQWFRDLNQSLLRLVKALKLGGILFFNVG